MNRCGITSISDRKRLFLKIFVFANVCDTVFQLFFRLFCNKLITLSRIFNKSCLDNLIKTLNQLNYDQIVSVCSQVSRGSSDVRNPGGFRTGAFRVR